jgi:hypothetical protein
VSLAIYYPKVDAKRRVFWCVFGVFGIAAGTLASPTIRYAAAPGIKLFRRNAKTLVLCLHVNKPLKHLITPQPPCQKTLCLILPIKEPFGLMRNQYQSKGTLLSLCNYLIGARRSPYQRTSPPTTRSRYLLCTIRQKSLI